MMEMTAEELLLRRYAAGERDFRDFSMIMRARFERDPDKAYVSGADLIGANLSKASLRGAQLGEVDFRRADLSGADLSGANLSKANLSKANLRGAKLGEVDFRRVDLSGADLSGAGLGWANLSGADLSGADLSWANLSGADLSWADLKGADLSGTDLKGADLESATLGGTRGCPRNRHGCRISHDLYERSGWTPDTLADWHRAGSIIMALDQFPEEARRAVLGEKEGLTLYFNTRLTHVDRFLVDGVIFNVLGKDTDCTVVEFRQQEQTALIRLQAAYREDMEAVAEALYRRAWEQQEQRVEEQALVKVTTMLSPSALQMLSELRDRIGRIELHVKDEARVAWRWDLAQDRLQLARPIRLFLSYAPEDDQLHRQLEGHLATLKRQGVIKNWHAGLMQAGAVRDAERQGRLDAADVVLVLVSADLLRSDDLFDELQSALARHKAGKARVIPVLARKVDLADTPLEQFQPLPEGGRAVTLWGDRDEAWASVTSGIRQVVMGMMQPSERPALPAGPTTQG